ncbi:hypothetical protein ACWGQ5_47915 [Streptomyces sp. NPDC055722]
MIAVLGPTNYVCTGHGDDLESRHPRAASPERSDGFQEVHDGQRGLAVHERLVQKAFRKKVNAALQGQQSGDADWSGVHAIIESIVHAFDSPTTP